MGVKKYTLEQLIEAVKSSISYCDVLKKLGLNYKGGGNYYSIKKYIEKNNLDTSHFLGQGHSKGKVFENRQTSIDKYLSNEVFITSNKLKLKLIKCGLLNHECSMCKLVMWNDKPIPIELDHIDGNHENNNLSNLRILCPNCHAQTETYCGKNISKHKFKQIYSCKLCGKVLNQKRKTNTCFSCLKQTKLSLTKFEK